MTKTLARLFATRDASRPFGQPYVVAEAGVNHEGRMDLAKRLIEEAREGGADAIKFQTYRAETLTSRHAPAYWDLTKEPATNQFELFKRYDKFWKREFEELKRHCDQLGIEFMSTPFDLESATFLNDLVAVFKIASADITNRPLIEHICRFEKPIILSTGASYIQEIEEAVGWVDASGNPVALLHCVLSYPTPERDANLGMITHLKTKFPDRVIGYSDHTLPADMRTLELAALLGAAILEKHFTHDKSLPGNDHYHAMDKEDLKTFRRHYERVLGLIGSSQKTVLAVEEEARRHARRSLVAAHTIPKGARITEADLTWKRPGHGIGPKHLSEVIGRIAKEEIAEDTVLTWTMLA